MRELTERGHQVTCYSFEPFRERIEAAGAVLAEPRRRQNAEKTGRSFQEAGGDPRAAGEILRVTGVC